jgi:hypothetical protein
MWLHIPEDSLLSYAAGGNLYKQVSHEIPQISYSSCLRQEFMPDFNVQMGHYHPPLFVIG